MKKEKKLTVAAVIGPQHYKDILEQWYEEYGVNDEGQYPQNVVSVVDAVGESTGVHVQRRRADIPINHP